MKAPAVAAMVQLGLLAANPQPESQPEPPPPAPSRQSPAEPVEPTSDPATAELPAESVAESTAELTAESTTEFASESTTELTVESATELTAESTADLTAESTGELPAEPIDDCASDGEGMAVVGPALIAKPEPEPAAFGCPVRLLIVDTETSGLDPVSGKCLEVGAVLFDVPHRAVLSQLSFLLPASANPARHVNGIDPAVTRLEQPWRQSLQMLAAMVSGADAVLAHNAAFDRQWFGIEPLQALDLPWICSMDDIRWPADRHLKPRPSVQALALAYGVPVWAAHRALTDCIYLVQVLERCEQLEQLLVEAQEPRQLFCAQLPYAERFRAKQAGFRWNDPVAGAWSRRLSEREARSLPFPVQPVCA
jgi:DNA polymerase-3 subunit epsilon